MDDCKGSSAEFEPQGGLIMSTKCSLMRQLESITKWERPEKTPGSSTGFQYTNRRSKRIASNRSAKKRG
jgi:hypothetical protein